MHVRQLWSDSQVWLCCWSLCLVHAALAKPPQSHVNFSSVVHSIWAREHAADGHSCTCTSGEYVHRERQIWGFRVRWQLSARRIVIRPHPRMIQRMIRRMYRRGACTGISHQLLTCSWYEVQLYFSGGRLHAIGRCALKVPGGRFCWSNARHFEGGIRLSAAHGPVAAHMHMKPGVVIHTAFWAN